MGRIGLVPVRAFVGVAAGAAVDYVRVLVAVSVGARPEMVHGEDRPGVLFVYAAVATPMPVPFAGALHHGDVPQ